MDVTDSNEATASTASAVTVKPVSKAHSPNSEDQVPSSTGSPACSAIPPGINVHVSAKRPAEDLPNPSSGSNKKMTASDVSANPETGPSTSGHNASIQTGEDNTNSTPIQISTPTLSGVNGGESGQSETTVRIPVFSVSRLILDGLTRKQTERAFKLLGNYSSRLAFRASAQSANLPNQNISTDQSAVSNNYHLSPGINLEFLKMLIAILSSVKFPKKFAAKCKSFLTDPEKEESRQTWANLLTDPSKAVEREFICYWIDETLKQKLKTKSSLSENAESRQQKNARKCMYGINQASSSNMTDRPMPTMGVPGPSGINLAARQSMPHSSCNTAYHRSPRTNQGESQFFSQYPTNFERFNSNQFPHGSHYRPSYTESTTTRFSNPNEFNHEELNCEFGLPPGSRFIEYEHVVTEQIITYFNPNTNETGQLADQNVRPPGSSGAMIIKQEVNESSDLPNAQNMQTENESSDLPNVQNMQPENELSDLQNVQNMQPENESSDLPVEQNMQHENESSNLPDAQNMQPENESSNLSSEQNNSQSNMQPENETSDLSNEQNNSEQNMQSEDDSSNLPDAQSNVQQNVQPENAVNEGEVANANLLNLDVNMNSNRELSVQSGNPVIPPHQPHHNVMFDLLQHYNFPGQAPGPPLGPGSLQWHRRITNEIIPQRLESLNTLEMYDSQDPELNLYSVGLWESNDDMKSQFKHCMEKIHQRMSKAAATCAGQYLFDKIMERHLLLVTTLQNLIQLVWSYLTWVHCSIDGKPSVRKCPCCPNVDFKLRIELMMKIFLEQIIHELNIRENKSEFTGSHMTEPCANEHCFICTSNFAFNSRIQCFEGQYARFIAWTVINETEHSIETQKLKEFIQRYKHFLNIRSCPYITSASFNFCIENVVYRIKNTFPQTYCMATHFTNQFLQHLPGNNFRDLLDHVAQKHPWNYDYSNQQDESDDDNDGDADDEDDDDSDDDVQLIGEIRPNQNNGAQGVGELRPNARMSEEERRAFLDDFYRRYPLYELFPNLPQVDPQIRPEDEHHPHDHHALPDEHHLHVNQALHGQYHLPDHYAPHNEHHLHDHHAPHDGHHLHGHPAPPNEQCQCQALIDQYYAIYNGHIQQGQHDHHGLHGEHHQHGHHAPQDEHHPPNEANPPGEPNRAFEGYPQYARHPPGEVFLPHFFAQPPPQFIAQILGMNYNGGQQQGGPCIPPPF